MQRSKSTPSNLPWASLSRPPKNPLSSSNEQQQLSVTFTATPFAQ
ncbi:unnamed protein product, partial [Nippostrongylus brasiliensis]|uniref:Uncharacterized protein n=1 Tax=Nippostrongylus brasiliensis TaxID=27835 RepID=A0A0N4YTU2_NIPBR